MKKIICLLLIVVLSLTMLAACGGYECAECGEKTDTVCSNALLGEEQYCKDCYNDLMGMDVID